MTIYDEIIAERGRQDAKWGEQNHESVPNDDDVREYWVSKEQTAKLICSAKLGGEGALTFQDIAFEEFAEVCAAPDDVARREELVQLAAVCVQWIEAIDRRKNKQDMSKERRLMRHALGLNNAKVAYRNRFTTSNGSDDYAMWKAFCATGLALWFSEEGDLTTFHLTPSGIAHCTSPEERENS